jgi:NAD(P)H-dependent flavin oxidoreductase YrpB (nitropropane dioxygenase family)
MNLPKLKIGDIEVAYPIIQGGMSVRISTAKLAAAVSNAGGIGIIGATGIPVEELKQAIRKCRTLTKGPVAVNIMFAAREFEELVKGSVEEGVDIIFTGAGFSRNVFKMVEGSNTKVVSIVSSPGFAKLAEKLGAHAIVVEAKEAGGHLGTDRPLKELFPECRKVVSKVPLIAAGGIVDAEGFAEAMNMGADGIQLATRFVLSEECEMPDDFKKMYLNSTKEDVMVIHSPAGMPGRALRNKFVDQLNAGEKVFDRCKINCLKDCDHKYCILDRLEVSQQGDVVNGLVFTGENVWKLNDILPVKTIMENFMEGCSKLYLGKPLVTAAA